jgi:FtsH-binding integral membrane protein
MKWIFIPVFTLTMVLIIAGIWIFQTGNSNQDLSFFSSEIIFIVAIVILFIVSIFFSAKRIKNRKQGLPEEDELSKKIVGKAGAKSFFASLFLWLAILYIHNNTTVDTGILFGYGIIGMAFIFITFTIIFNVWGIKNE